MGRIPPDWRERFAPAFDIEFRAFIAAAAEGRVAGPSAWDGYVATVTTLAGVKALRSKKTEPVKLRKRPALYTNS
jgi:myo-inositol 2-dehydrogenase/D-chiro-inositol 1-dehydrogenase